MTTPDTPSRAGSKGGSPTILLAEDEAMVRSVMIHMLSKLGFRVLTAADGQAAVELFIRHLDEVDLVIFDMTMPTMSGEELFVSIKKLAPRVKTLLTSGNHERHLIEALMHKGLSGFLPKPFNMSEMQGAISHILEGDC